MKQGFSTRAIHAGQPNEEKGGRPSWAGKPVPTVQRINLFGQILVVDQDNNIHAKYCFSKDRRQRKFSIIPRTLQKDHLTLALWKKDSLKSKIENKFNQKG